MPVSSAVFEVEPPLLELAASVTRAVDVDDVEKPADLRPLTTSPAEERLDVREMAGFPLRLVSRLPDAATLFVRGGGRYAVMTTSRVAYEAARSIKWPVFVGGEFDWLALAVENDRASWADMERWLARKLDLPTWRLDANTALGDIASSAVQPPLDWPVGRILGRLGLELIAVGAGDEVPW